MHGGGVGNFYVVVVCLLGSCPLQHRGRAGLICGEA